MAVTTAPRPASTMAPAPLPRLHRSAPSAPAWTPPPAPISGETAEARRELAVELAVEAQLAEDAGVPAEIVEAVRRKARSVLRGRDNRSMAPMPLALRREQEAVALRVA